MRVRPRCVHRRSAPSEFALGSIPCRIMPVWTSGDKPAMGDRGLRALIARVVGHCARHPWPVLVVAAALGLFACVYAARHIAIDTDTAKLIARDLPWRVREIDFAK